MTTVKELIEFLQSVDPDRIVVLSSDEEGNSYSHLSGWDADQYHYNEEEKEINEFDEEYARAEWESYNEHLIEGRTPAQVNEAWITFCGDSKPCLVLWP